VVQKIENSVKKEESKTELRNYTIDRRANPRNVGLRANNHFS
jgi:hypothetical protein